MKIETRNNAYRLIQIFDSVEPFYITSLVFIGLICNTVSLFFFTLKKNKYKRSILTLSVLAISDNGFLIALQIIYLNYFDMDFFNKYNSVCKLSVYISYVTSFLSIW